MKYLLLIAKEEKRENFQAQQFLDYFNQDHTEEFKIEKKFVREEIEIPKRPRNLSIIEEDFNNELRSSIKKREETPDYEQLFKQIKRMSGLNSQQNSNVNKGISSNSRSVSVKIFLYKNKNFLIEEWSSFFR